jgi:hypothetical protein
MNTATRLLAVLLLLAGCATDPDAGSPCGLAKRGEVAVEAGTPVPIVTVALPAGTGRFIFDTGAERTVIRAPSAERLKLAPIDGSRIPIAGANGAALARLTEFAGATLGDAPLPPTRAVIIADADSRGLNGADGSLGMDVLRRYDLDLDFPHHRVALYAGHACPGEPLPLPGPLTDVRTPKAADFASNARDSRLYARVSLEGRPFTGLVDSGTALSLIFWEDMPQRRNPATPGPLRDAILRGFGNSDGRASVYQFSEYSIAGHAIPAPQLIVQTRGRPDTVQMIIGQDVLSRHRIWLSRRDERVGVATP